MPRQTEKEVLKEALQEWLDSKFASFGKWSAYGIGAAIIVLVGYFTLVMNGWKPPV